MTAVVEINKLESELKELQKKRGEVEYRLKSLEKAQQGLLGKRNRTDSSNLQNKRFKENEDNGGKEEVKSGSREEFRPSLNSRIISDRDRDREPINKPSNRLSSVVTGQRSRDVRELKDSSRDFRAPREPRDSRDPRDSRAPRDSYASRTNREEIRKPKLTSAIVSPTPIPVVGEKPRPSLDTSSEETKKRSRNMFGVLVETLKSFKNDISKKSEAEQRREEIEQKVHSKVKEEEQTFKEEQRRLLQEQKDKELSLREEIKQQQEQKELELLNLKWDSHRTQLSVFLKTEAKPAIYYKPIKVDSEVKKEEQKGSSSSSEHNQRTGEDNKKKEEQEEK